MHVPLTQVGEAVGQTLPHTPQLFGSLDKFVHAGGPAAVGQHFGLDAVQHWLLQQSTGTPVAVKHMKPQVPQFLGSLLRSVHMPPKTFWQQV